jgi:hypothetical protein
MFRKALKKKRNVAALSVVAVLALAGMAFAFWTTTGSGSGSGSVAASNGTLALHGTITSELTPGGSSAVTFKADNTNTSSEEVGTVSAVVSIDAEHATKGCKAADFTIADTIENQVIAAEKSGVALAHNGSISMTETGENQDACKGATISLALSSL